jgi:hypothetical protein
VTTYQPPPIFVGHEVAFLQILATRFIPENISAIKRVVKIYKM